MSDLTVEFKVFLSLAKRPVNGFPLPLIHSQENLDKDLLDTENQKQIMMFCLLQLCAFTVNTKEVTPINTFVLISPDL